MIWVMSLYGFKDVSMSFENLSLDRMVERQSGLLRQLEARDFSRVRLHNTIKIYFALSL